MLLSLDFLRLGWISFGFAWITDCEQLTMIDTDFGKQKTSLNSLYRFQRKR